MAATARARPEIAATPSYQAGQTLVVVTWDVRLGQHYRRADEPFSKPLSLTNAFQNELRPAAARRSEERHARTDLLTWAGRVPRRMEDPGFDLVAASLRADTTDLVAFVEALAVKLEGALPDGVTVERRGDGLLSRTKRVRRISIGMDEARYDLERVGDSIQTSRCNEVRGIVIKSERLGLDEWIDALSRELTERAQQSERSRLALQRLLEG
jgi:hypothetical protein